jgi:hypothetical protein
MSKNINVNTGQYKVAGRERPGKDIPEPERSKNIPGGGRKTTRKPGQRSSPKR